MAATFAERVALTASTFRPARALLSVLAMPFYALGLLIGLLLVMVSWSVAAVLVGVGEVRGRLDAPSRDDGER